MVGNTVNNYAKSESVSLSKEGLEVSHRSELRVDVAVVSDRIV